MRKQPGRRHASLMLETKLESCDTAEEMARQAAAHAGFDEEEQFRISLAVREGVINAVQHGNRADEQKKVELGIEMAGGGLQFIITDEGEGFDPARIPDPREDERLLASSGRGLFLMRTFMDDVQIEPTKSGGTRLILWKGLSLTNSTAGANPEKEKSS